MSKGFKCPGCPQRFDSQDYDLWQHYFKMHTYGTPEQRKSHNESPTGGVQGTGYRRRRKMLYGY